MGNPLLIMIAYTRKALLTLSGINVELTYFKTIGQCAVRHALYSDTEKINEITRNHKSWALEAWLMQKIGAQNIIMYCNGKRKCNFKKIANISLW